MLEFNVFSILDVLGRMKRSESEVEKEKVALREIEKTSDITISLYSTVFLYWYMSERSELLL